MREAMSPVSLITERDQVSRFFKALADDTRREILALLERRERTVGEIVGRFALSQPTISRHLQVLREAELVRSERRGQHVVYRLQQETLARGAGAFFGRFRRCRQASFELPMSSSGGHGQLSAVRGSRYGYDG